MWVPSPSLQVIQNWKRMICRMVALQFRGAWTDWKTVQSSTKGNAPGKDNSMHQHTLWVNWLEKRFAESTLGLMADSRLTISQQHAFAAQKASSILCFIRKNIASSLRQIILPLLTTSVGILTRRALYMEEFVIYISVNLSRCMFVLHVQCGLQATSCCTNPLASGWAHPAYDNRGPSRQLSLGLAIAPPAWPCFYLNVWKRFSCKHPFVWWWKCQIMLSSSKKIL